MSTELHGHIELIIGPMFAGKTTELMRRVRRETVAQRSCCVIKHLSDVRYDRANLSSHDRTFLCATFTVAALRDIGDAWRAYDVVAVDEGQFYPDVIDFCNTAADAGKTVIVSALDGDFLRRPFDAICRLVPLAESVKKLSAVCMRCHERDASFTFRTVPSVELELVGGADMYISTCRVCYNKSAEDMKTATGGSFETTANGDKSPKPPVLRKEVEQVKVEEKKTVAPSESPAPAATAVCSSFGAAQKRSAVSGH